MFDAINQSANSLAMGIMHNATPERLKVYNDHQRVWWKEYGKSTYIAMAACFAHLISIGFVAKMMGKPAVGYAFVAFLLVWSAVWTILYQKNKQVLTPAELNALLPSLEVSPLQHAYIECVITLSEVKIAPEARKEIIDQLNRLLDEEQRLRSIQDRGSDGVPILEEIRAEREALEAKLAATEDPFSRDALDKSLELLQQREAAAGELALVESRVDAQFQMLSQAIRGVRDSLRRLASTPKRNDAVLDLDTVRSYVSMAHEHATALEKAVEEVRTLA